MRLFLVGMMGSGKSTIGRILSSVLDQDFVDMDTEIEKRTGKKIGTIFDNDGESAFRKLEKSLLKELISRDNVIVSTGGGVILDEENRRILRTENTIYLKLTPADLFKRVGIVNRPLLRNGKNEIYRIWQERRGFYEQFPSVETSVMSKWEAVASICMRIISQERERLVGRNHPVTIAPGSFQKVGGMPNTIISKRVRKIYSEWVPSSALSIEDGEEAKGFQTLLQVYDFLMECGLSRGDMLVAAGGGTVTDLVGFGASTFKRGIPLTLYPTTLLSQVDASIGGKNGINFRGCKNMIGNFYFPSETIVDPVVTLSMDEGRFEEGLVEAFKIFLITGTWYEQFMERLHGLKERNLSSLSEMLEEAIKEKDRIVAMDTNERGIRKILNLGHTLGHIYEPITGVSHGMAVAWGLEREMYYFTKLGIVDEAVYRDVIEAISVIFELDSAPPLVPSEEALRLLKNDKKGLSPEERGIEMPVVKSPGVFEMVTVKLDELLGVIA